jgi:hypothetical protein
MTVSFFCVQTRMKKYKMITSLKSIVLLNDTIREVRSTLQFHDLRLYNNIHSLFLFLYDPFRRRREATKLNPR